MNISYHLSGGLSGEQLIGVRNLSQSILEEIGLEIDHDEICSFLGSQKGVQIRGKRVCYDKMLFEQCLEQQKMQNADYVWQWPNEDDFIVRPSYLCLNLYDPITGHISQTNIDDLRQAVKLCDSYDMSGTCPVHPQDVPDSVRQIAAAKVCIENSRGVGKWMVVSNIDEIRCITEMSKLAGRTGPYVNMQITISPMRLNVEYLDIIWQLRNSPDFADGLTIGGGAIPMLGATAPLNLPAAWAQAAAEAIGAYITVKLIASRVIANACFQVFPFDMRTAAFVMGTPEGALSRLIGKQIQQFLFGRTLGASFGTMGLPLDPQSTAQRMGNVLVEALAGSRVFYDAGMASVDELFCPEQVVIDHEIILWVKRFIRGFEFRQENEVTLDSIRQGISEGTFLMQEWTLDHKDFYWTGELFKSERLSNWLAGSRRSIAQRARNIVEARLKNHNFSLAADVLTEINRVYEKMTAKLSCQ
jgi:trimethylamine:corrinoid methyltransferase-like protein